MLDRHTVLQERERTWPILNRPALNNLMFSRKYKDKEFFVDHHFDRRCVCNRKVKGRGNLSLTNCVGYDKLLFNGRYIYTVSMGAGRRRPKRKANIKSSFTMAISLLSTPSSFLIHGFRNGNR